MGCILYAVAPVQMQYKPVARRVSNNLHIYCVVRRMADDNG